MAGLVRKALIPFGDAGPTSSFGQFGSKTAGTPQTSQDPTVIQQLAAWQQGWQNAIVSGDKAAYLEDMNGWCFVHSYEVAYIFQSGIPEWDASTLYFNGSVVQTMASGQQFRSLSGGVPGVGAGQSGNAPPASASNAFWLWTNPPQELVGTATLNKIPKVTNTAPANGVPGSVTLGDSAVSDDGTDVILALPLKFPDNTVQSTAAVSSNAVTVQSPPAVYVTTPSRTIGSVYQNTGSKPRFVVVTVLTAGVCQALCDSNPSPVTQVAATAISGAPAVRCPLPFWVLPGYYYLVSGGSLDSWIEWT